MPCITPPDQINEFRLFIEEIMFNLLRHEHVAEEGILPEQLHIHQEVYLGHPKAFADIAIGTPGHNPYYVEVMYGYSRNKMIADMQEKYGVETEQLAKAEKVLLVTHWTDEDDGDAIAKTMQEGLCCGLKLEVWNAKTLAEHVNAGFGMDLDFSGENSLALRYALDDSKGRYVFGDKWSNDLLQSALLWHYGYWRVKQVLDARDGDINKVFPPGDYPQVVAVLADLSSFSAFVRDTRDRDVLRNSLTSFYNKARYEIINAGGMMYQFVGDEVVGLFGIPEHTPGYIDDALECARALVDIGKAVANDWQSQIDRVQKNIGVHVGVAVGDMQFVPLRPYGPARLGAVSDSINMGARLLGEAEADEIVVSNTFYQKLSEDFTDGFEALDGVDAKNMGRIRAWKYKVRR